AGVLGRYDEALDRYAAAATAVGAGSAVPRARLQRKTAVVHQRRGRIDEALALIAAALVDLPAGASAERGRVLLAAADMSFRAGRHDDALRQLADARQEAERAGDDAGLAEALKQLGTVHGYRGDLAEALRYQVESLAAYERAGQRTYTVEALRDLADAYIAAGSPRAIEVAERAVRVAREMSLGALVAIALQALGKARLAHGELVDAASALEESRQLLGTTGDRHELG